MLFAGAAGIGIFITFVGMKGEERAGCSSAWCMEHTAGPHHHPVAWDPRCCLAGCGFIVQTPWPTLLGLNVAWPYTAGELTTATGERWRQSRPLPAPTEVAASCFERARAICLQLLGTTEMPAINQELASTRA